MTIFKLTNNGSTPDGLNNAQTTSEERFLAKRFKLVVFSRKPFSEGFESNGEPLVEFLRTYIMLTDLLKLKVVAVLRKQSVVDQLSMYCVHPLLKSFSR